MYLTTIQHIKATGESPCEMIYLQRPDNGKICIKSWQDSLSDFVKRDAVSALRSNLDQRRISEARSMTAQFRISDAGVVDHTCFQ